MSKSIQTFLAGCKALDFGSAASGAAQQDLYRMLNDEIIDLCRSLPKSIRMDATRFILGYAGLSPGDELDFFKKYYTPTWSILYWIKEASPDSGELPRDIYADIAAIHSMAMFLHSLDDHLNDGALPASHLLLLLRSQAWHKMMTAIQAADRYIDDGISVANRLIDTYYEALNETSQLHSLNEYCDQFLGQMSTGLIAPELLLRSSAVEHHLASDLVEAFRHFGLAWRLLDDINDIEEDLQNGCHSAVYHSLPENIQSSWNHSVEADNCTGDHGGDTICTYIVENGIIAELIGRIIDQLETAAGLVANHGLKGFSEEFNLLLMPFRQGGDTYYAI